MKQEYVASIILIIIGLFLVFLPRKVWTVAEAWKSDGKEPSKSYMMVIKVVGVIFVATGIFVFFV